MGRARTKSRLANSRHLKRRKALESTNRYKNVILLLMLLVFVIGWLPVNILNILEDLEVPLVCWPYYYFLFFTFHVIAMTTTCCNPLFYGFLNSRRLPRSEDLQ